jgi:hypothetical protein
LNFGVELESDGRRFGKRAQFLLRDVCGGRGGGRRGGGRREEWEKEKERVVRRGKGRE